MTQAKLICAIDELIPNTGVGALVDGVQVALFRVMNSDGEFFFAVSNRDPFSGANVLARGIVGSIQERIIVASPVYKQHFDLRTGQCLEDDSVQLECWPVHLRNGQIYIETRPVEVAA